MFDKTNITLYKIAFISYYRKLRDKNESDHEIPYGETALMNKKSFLCMGQIIFNKLPESMKTPNLDQLKRKLLTILVKKNYYSLNDYLADSSIISPVSE